MLEDLTEKLERALRKITGQGKLTETNISDTLRDIRRVLLDADVNYKVARQFIEDVKAKALGREVLNSVTPGQLVTKILYDELTNLLGGKGRELSLNPLGITVIMLIGLQGCGKTTFGAKLAKYLLGKNRNVLLVAADVYRPAAVDQLKILGSQIGVPVFSIEGSSEPVKIAAGSLIYAKANGIDTVIIDTAGRLHIDDDMMNEAAQIKAEVDPTEVLFVVDSMTGQDAVNSAKAFHEKVDFDGVVLTKMDGDAKGGCVLSIRGVVERPVKFVSLGEKLDSFELFFPDRMASRILGKGDIISLVEKAQEQIDEKEAFDIEKKFRENKFDFDDFLNQIKMIKKMGSLKSLLGMIPGLGSSLKGADVDEKQLIRVESIIQSMTKIERNNPRILNGSRRKRIARGSGNSIQDVNRLIKQFEGMQQMMKMLNKNNGKLSLQNMKNIRFN
jgi:signal recognition particle subunit SRP54